MFQALPLHYDGTLARWLPWLPKEVGGFGEWGGLSCCFFLLGGLSIEVSEHHNLGGGFKYFFYPSASIILGPERTNCRSFEPIHWPPVKPF